MKKNFTNLQIMVLIHHRCFPGVLPQMTGPKAQWAPAFIEQVDFLTDNLLLEETPESSLDQPRFETTNAGDIVLSLMQSAPIPPKEIAREANSEDCDCPACKPVELSESEAKRLLNDFFNNPPVGYQMFSGVDKQGRTHTFSTANIMKHLEGLEGVLKGSVASTIHHINETTKDDDPEIRRRVFVEYFQHVTSLMIDEEDPESVRPTYKHKAETFVA